MIDFGWLIEGPRSAEFPIPKRLKNALSHPEWKKFMDEIVQAWKALKDHMSDLLCCVDFLTLATQDENLRKNLVAEVCEILMLEEKVVRASVAGGPSHYRKAIKNFQHNVGVFLRRLGLR